MRQRLPLILSITALIVAMLGWTGVGEATRNALVPKKNSVGTKQIKNRSILMKDLNRRTITALRQPLPEPKRGRGVTISYGAYPATSFKIEGARIVDDDNVLGQFVYTGSYECQPDFVTFEATIFNAAGQIIDTTSGYIDDPAQDVRYPLEFYVSSDEKTVRAEVVMTSASCPF
jgi:hypothetical protein